MPGKIDRDADTQDRCRRNWQRLVAGAATSTILVDNTTIGFNGSGELIVLAGGIGTTQLANDSVTFAKMQNIPTDSLIGRDTAGTGDPESITVTGGIVFSGTGSIQTTAFTGDVTKTLGGTSLTIANDAVTFAKFQNITDNRLLGRSAGSTGDMMEITLGSGLSMSGGTLTATGTGGTVTSFSFTNANGVAGVVTNPTTTPNLTISLGAITPTSVAASGTVTGSNLSGTNTGDQTSIVGITGTLAQFNTALTGADFASGGGTATGTNTGDQTITLTGDVTGSGTGSFAATIANDAVTYAKIQNVTSDRLLGRDTAGSGDTEEITVGGGIEFTGSTGIQTSAFTGDVTKTSGGTALTIANDAVTFAKFQNITDNRLLGRSAGSTGDIMEITIGSGLTLSGGSLTATGSGGTVTSVSVVTANGISGSVATATTTPAITLTLGAITPTTVNALTLASQAVGFTIAGGTTSKTLTVPLDASVSGTNTGDQTITLTGDVTGSGTGSFAATIANDAVTYAKMQNVTDNRLLGRSAGSTGDPMEITIGSGLSLSAGSLSATFSSPLTTKGDIFTFTTVNARLAVGTNGQMIVADSGATAGIKWSGPSNASLLFSTSGPSVQLADASLYVSGSGIGVNTDTKSLNIVGGELVMVSARDVAGDPGAFNGGEFWYDTTAGADRTKMAASATGQILGMGGTLYVQTADSNAVTGAETDFNKNVTLAAAYLTVGRVLRFFAWGTYDDTLSAGTASLSLRFRLGTVQVNAAGNQTVVTVTGGSWSFFGTIICTAVGATGKVNGGGRTTVQNGAVDNTNDVYQATVDTTGTLVAKISAAWTFTGLATGTTTMRGFVLESLN